MINFKTMTSTSVPPSPRECKTYVELFGAEVCSWRPQVPIKLWLTRHGQSAYNVEDRIGGDSPITAQGQKFADALPRLFAKILMQANHDPRFVTVFTSTLLRTIQTASKLPLPQVQLWELDELDAGECDGMTYADIKRYMRQVDHDRKRDKLGYQYPSGESYLDLCLRVLPVLKQLQQRGGNVLVVAHQAVLRCFFGFFLGKPLVDITHLEVPHHCVFEVTILPSGKTSMQPFPMELVTEDHSAPLEWPFPLTSRLPRHPAASAPNAGHPRARSASARYINRHPSLKTCPTAHSSPEIATLCERHTGPAAAAPTTDTPFRGISPAGLLARHSPCAAADAELPREKSALLLASSGKTSNASPASRGSPVCSSVGGGTLASELDLGRADDCTERLSGSCSSTQLSLHNLLCPSCGWTLARGAPDPPSAPGALPDAGPREEPSSDFDYVCDNIGNLGIPDPYFRGPSDPGGGADRASALRVREAAPPLGAFPPDAGSPLPDELLRRKLDDDDGYWQRRQTWTQATAHSEAAALTGASTDVEEHVLRVMMG